MKFNLKPLDLRFVSEENGKPCHKHILNGQEVPGCSSIAGMFDKGEWRMPWATKMMYEQASKNIEMGFDEKGEWAGTFVDLDAMLVSAKMAWKNKRDKTADTGTLLHKHLEIYIKERLSGRAPAEAAPALIASAKDFPLQVLQFLDWEKANNVEWLAAELHVGFEKHMYAGLADCVYRLPADSLIYLDDFKTSEKPKTEWVQQLVGLRAAAEDMGLPIAGTGSLWMPRNGVFKRIPYEYDMVKEFAGFLAAKDFYSARNLFHARHKTKYKGAK